MDTALFTCFAIAAPGLEPIVARELTALGERPRVEDGGVTWEGDARSVMRANLWLRSASRVLVRVAEFKATAFYELEKRAKKIPWDAFLARGQGAEFRVTARKSKLYHSDAIAERLLIAVGLPPTALGLPPAETTVGGKRKAGGREPKAVRQLFVVRVVRDTFEISADTSGDLLHMRGYRQAIGKAPLRETLAAALLLAADWSGDAPLLDPMCGSGTIPIEGALIARRIAPGLHRRFAFMEWPTFDEKAWRRLVSDAEAVALECAPASILASDRDAGAIASARANAERASVAADIDFSVRAISAIEPPATAGLIATNPPYGVRVSEGSNVRNLYAQFGKVARARCAGWRVTFFAPEARLVQEFGLPLDVALRTSNGGIKVTVVSGTIPAATTASAGDRR